MTVRHATGISLVILGLICIMFMVYTPVLVYMFVPLSKPYMSVIHNSLKLPHFAPSSNTSSSAHWGVSSNDSCILLQVDDGKKQARIRATPEEALEIAMALIGSAHAFYLAAQLENGK